MHGREELGQNGFKMDNVPEGAEISLGPVGTVKNYTPGEKIKPGHNAFKCSGSFFKNCDGDYICKCWRVQ